jgi:flagellar protein FliS
MKLEVEEIDASGDKPSPLRLVIILYDRAIRFMEAGRYAIEHDDRELQRINLDKAQQAVMEMTTCLNMDKGGEIAHNLMSIYTYMHQELIEANVSSRVEPIDRCLRMLAFLRETWVGVVCTETEATELAQRAA